MIDEEFLAACKKIEENHTALDNTTVIKIYGYYKQATEGDVVGSRPSILKLRARTKYDAWAEVSGMTSTEAKLAYIEIVNNLKLRDEKVSCEEREAALEDKHSLAKEMLNKN